MFKGAEECLHPSHPEAVASHGHLGRFVGTAEAVVHSPLPPGGSAHTDGRKARLALSSSAPLAIPLCQLQCPPKQSVNSANWANWKLILAEEEKSQEGSIALRPISPWHHRPYSQRSTRVSRVGELPFGWSAAVGQLRPVVKPHSPCAAERVGVLTKKPLCGELRCQCLC